MNKHTYITISEYWFLWTKEDLSLYSQWKSCYINKEAFENLRKFILDERNKASEIMWISIKKWYWEVINVKNYVWVIQTIDGTTIEILPKIHNVTDEKKVRKIFLKMLKTLKNSHFKNINEASLKNMNFPILEIFISLFLEELGKLIKRWIKKNYVTLEDNMSFLKWKLRLNDNVKRNFIHKERFSIEYDEFIENIPENKLIKSCLIYLSKLSKNERNINRIKEYVFVFNEIEESKNYESDFECINSVSRLHSHYEQVLVWVRIFLRKQSVVSFIWNTVTLSLLYPMEKIFENYVAKKVKEHWGFAYITTQDTRYSLVEEHIDKEKFSLRPDIVASRESHLNECIIIDTKWKILNENDSKNNYGISQSDMYQLYAYAKKYNSRELYLIYPKCETFQKDSLLPFYYHKEEKIFLEAVNYDLETDMCCIMKNT
jgi:5-methylcytosine-specific restriction enzyme subunit McrC